MDEPREPELPEEPAHRQVAGRTVAGWGLRTGAAIVTLGLCWSLSLLTHLVWVSIDSAQVYTDVYTYSKIPLALTFYAVLTVLGMLIWPGQSFSHRMGGAQLITPDGESVSVGKGFVRTWVCFFLYAVVLIIPVDWAMVLSSKRVGFRDRLASTELVTGAPGSRAMLAVGAVVAFVLFFATSSMLVSAQDSAARDARVDALFDPQDAKEGKPSGTEADAQAIEQLSQADKYTRDWNKQAEGWVKAMASETISAEQFNTRTARQLKKMNRDVGAVSAVTRDLPRTKLRTYMVDITALMHRQLTHMASAVVALRGGDVDLANRYMNKAGRTARRKTRIAEQMISNAPGMSQATALQLAAE